MELKEQEYFKELLLKEKTDKERLMHKDKLGIDTSIKDGTSELSSYDNHPGDLASETFEAEKNISFRKNYKTIIKLIDSAIERINNGKYGLCMVCNKDIELDRLKLIPYTELCSECQKKHHSGLVRKTKRPIEEKVLAPTLVRAFKDEDCGEGDTQFDGEDTWQAVNVYNVITSDNAYSKEDSMGQVEDVESISNEKYKKQLE